MWRSTATGAAMLLLAATSAALAGTEAPAQQSAGWLLDAQSRCYVLHTDSHPADQVMWSGSCANRRAEDSGTATFLLNGHFTQAISGHFSGGIPVGEARVVWADGGHFEGAMIAGRPVSRGPAAASSGAGSQAPLPDIQPNGAAPLPHTTSPADNSRVANAMPLRIVPVGTEGAAANVAASSVSVVGSAPANTPTAAISVPEMWLDAFNGQKLVTADGTVASVSVSHTDIALTMPAGSAVSSAYLTFLNASQGLVFDNVAGGKPNGLFRVSDAALIIDYAAGGSATLSRTGTGGLAIATSGASSTCTVWYPEGHAFSAAEREAAVAAYASRLGVVRVGVGPAPNCGDSPAVQADGSTEIRSNAPIRRSHRVATSKTALSASAPEIAADPVVLRASDVHLIDGAFSVPAPDARPALNFAVADKPAAEPSSPSQCLSVEANGADVGFRNRCGFEVQFAYCVVDATDPARLCGTGAPVGGVPANSFGPLFAQHNPKDPEHEFRWIACGGGRGEVMPKLLRTDPPAGQCVRARAS